MIALQINRNLQSFDDDPSIPLSWHVRDELDLTVTKLRCGMALCGSSEEIRLS